MVYLQIFYFEINLYTYAAKAPPMNGPATNTHTQDKAAGSPHKIAGPKLRAGFTEVPVK